MNSHLNRRSIKLLSFSLLALGLFQLASQMRQQDVAHSPVQPANTVVIAAPILVALYAGDRFLGSNIEAIRVATIGPSEEQSLAGYRIRAYDVASQLNPCQEDNFYMANAMLSWGGAVDEANLILQRATECRVWDEAPPFLLGFNRYFFHGDIDAAVEAMDMAASRSHKNRAAIKKISIVMTSKKLNDEKMAAAYLQKEREQATDQKLIQMLDRRIARLNGLITLRDAQSRFEASQGRPLTNPDELVTSGTLDEFPRDPMKIGYEFVEGQFRMKSVTINGREIRQ